jgi:uncharacterized domain HDIG
VDREKAFEALKLRIENPDTILHSLAAEAIMRHLARHFHEDEDLWGIAGLVHDIDLERINGDMSLHGKMGGDILEILDFDQTIVYAVRAHNPANNMERRRRIDKALYCTSPMARLIMACVEFTRSKSPESVDSGMVMKYFADAGFEPQISRERIASCSELGLSVEDFAEISLKALKENL